MNDLKLCANCLQDVGNERPTDIGPQKGSQRDPYREHVQLCEPCKAALLGGDFATLHERYSDTRTVTRGTP